MTTSGPAGNEGLRLRGSFSRPDGFELGMNLLLLAHLGGAAWLQVRSIRGSGSVAAEQRWHTAYLPVYGAWAGLVVVLFPPLFRYL